MLGTFWTRLMYTYIFIYILCRSPYSFYCNNNKITFEYGKKTFIMLLSVCRRRIFLLIKSPGVYHRSIELSPALSDRNRQVSNHNAHRGDLRGWLDGGGGDENILSVRVGEGRAGYKGLGVSGTIGAARRCCSPEKSRGGPKRQILGAIMTARTQTGRVDIPYCVLRVCCSVYKYTRRCMTSRYMTTSFLRVQR